MNFFDKFILNKNYFKKLTFEKIVTHEQILPLEKN